MLRLLGRYIFREITSSALLGTLLAGLSKKKASIHKNHVAEAAVLGSVLFAATGHLLIKSGLNALANANAQAGFAPRLFGYVQHSAVMCQLGVEPITPGFDKLDQSFDRRRRASRRFDHQR